MRIHIDPGQPLVSQVRAHGAEQRGRASGTRLYRFHDEADRLLYLGVTCNIPERWQGHKTTSEWWPQVAYVDVSSAFEHEAYALRAEVAAIREEAPLYNRRSSLTNQGGLSE